MISDLKSKIDKSEIGPATCDAQNTRPSLHMQKVWTRDYSLQGP